MRTTRRSTIAAFTIVAIVLLAAACGPDGSGPGFKAPSSEDFSGMSWTDAFEKMNDKMSREYAFTEWKGIDWKALYDEFGPLIEKAEQAGSMEDYYVTLRKYLCSFMDGHMGIDGDDLGLAGKLFEGGFGLTLERLDDGRIIANWVKEGGPAGRAGVSTGAEVLEWAGKPIGEALAQTETCFSLYPPATDEMLGCMQRYFLVRAPVGEERSVTFLSPGAPAAVTATMTAIDDGMETLQHSYSLVGFPPSENKDGVTSMVVPKTLPGEFGYIKIEGEYDLPSELKGDRTPTMELYDDAVQGFIDAGAPGLVLDVRSNDGGSDQMVADMMSRLFAESSFYEYQNWYDAESGGMEIILVDDESGNFSDPGKGITVEPGSPRFEGPVVVLVNPACISSGEGIAMCVDRLPAGEVAGFRGTNGSFGMVYGPLIKMPGGYSITYPIGQSLDEEKMVQLDSREGKGGVSPSRPVPLTAENAVRAGNGEDVELEYAVQLLQGIVNK
ncbi:MAG: hypothetical protein KKF41_02735 [Actinobacteria bacterium]|nr:hypothetical protein [Actinomycetota bacterium]MBU1945284.1 hypothetical protein [Actinomycetota bacterium]MBU2686484.1 hypothetical protein [Actinomycetota bacterium]